MSSFHYKINKINSTFEYYFVTKNLMKSIKMKVPIINPVDLAKSYVLYKQFILKFIAKIVMLVGNYSSLVLMTIVITLVIQRKERAVRKEVNLIQKKN